MKNHRGIRAAVAVLTAVTVLVGVSACTQGSDAQTTGQEQTETAFAQQQAAVPYPGAELRNSLERQNLRERLLRTNKPTLLQYVYLLGMNGNYIGYYAIKGKVSSTQSQMTTDNLVINRSSSNPVVVNAPGDDGSYGTNEPGIFFFTTEGVMVTTDMHYIVSDAPLAVSAPRLNVPQK